MIVSNRAELNAQDRWKETPLHKACTLGYPDLVKLLVKKGADTTIIDEEGMPPLYITARDNKGEMLKALLDEGGANIHYAVRQDDGWTALHVAAYFGHVEIVTILHEANANLELRDDEGLTPLMLATKEKHLGVMRELLCDGKEGKRGEGHVRQHEDAGHHTHDHGPRLLAVAQVDAQDNDGETPLFVAAAYGFLAGVRLLMNHGADCNKPDDTFRTPLIAASRWRNKEVVLALLQHEKPAEVNAQDERKQTASHKAAIEGHAKVLELLLNNGANVAMPDYQRRLPLHLASLQGDVAAANLLLKHAAGQQLETRDEDGMTPLLIASRAGDKDVEHTPLEDLGPEDLNEEEGSMPQFKSGRHGAVVELLLKSGASPEAKTTDGRTALRLALESQDGKDYKLQQFARYMKFNKEQDRLRSTLKTSAPAATREDYDDLSNWAAEDFRRHAIAKVLIEGRFTSSAPPPPKEANAIAWAAWANLPGLLWLLLAKTPWDQGTLMDIKSLITLLECLKTPTPESQLGKEGPEQGRKGDGAGSQENDYSIVRDYIRDPPLGLLCNVHTNSQVFELPIDMSQSDISTKEEAAVFQFYKGESRLGRIATHQNVREVIYGKGSQNIIEAMMKNVKHHIKDLEPTFTWVHLPSTNVKLNSYKLKRKS